MLAPEMTMTCLQNVDYRDRPVTSIDGPLAMVKKYMEALSKTHSICNDFTHFHSTLSGVQWTYRKIMTKGLFSYGI